MTSTLKKVRKWFWLAFLFSTVLLVVIIAIAEFYEPPLKGFLPGPPTATETTALIVALVSFLTSIVSFVGAVTTTILAWRKDIREAHHNALDLKKKEIELEKLRREIQELTPPQQDQQAS